MTKSFPSPCRGICRLDERQGHCLGCGRSEMEITRWTSMTEAERGAVLARLEAEHTREEVGE